MKRNKKLNIMYKLILGFGILIVAWLVNSIITIKTLSNNRKIIEEIANNYIVSLSQLQELSDLVIDSKLLIKTWVYIDKKNDTQDKIRLKEIHATRFPNTKMKLEKIYGYWTPEERLKLNTILKTISDTLFSQQKYVMAQLDSFDKYNDPMIFFEISFLMEEDQGETMLLINKIKDDLEELIAIYENKVTLSKIEMNNSLKRFGTMVFFMAIIFLVLLLITAYFMSQMIVKPISKLTNAADLMSTGNLNVKVDIQTKDEIQLLAEAFNHMAENLKISRDKITAASLRLADEHKKVQEANDKITASIHYAKYIQNAILPPTELVNNILHDNFVLFKPKDIVSGDFYWVQQIDNLSFVAVVDCTGHGVPGAFMSMLAYAFLNEIVGRANNNVAQILNSLRIQVKHSLRQETDTNVIKDGMDIALCLIDNENHTLLFSGAYRPLYHIRDATLNEVKADKMPIGLHIFEKDSFTQHELKLQKNDVIYIFTDGYHDQFGGDENRKFLTKKFKELLLEIHTLKMNEQKQILDIRFEQWKGNRQQVDDVLVIGIKIW